MKLKNWEKALVLKLLENERFSIMQHAQKVKREEGTNLDNWAASEAKFINAIITKLELTRRDPTEEL